MYNNERWVEKNLTMIFAQDYKNFRVIIVDDGSTDNTTGIIEKFIASHEIGHRVTLVKNKIRKRKLANLYNVLYKVKDKEIVVIIDGDDWLAHNHIFSFINRLYEEDIFFTYGQYENVPATEAIAWGFDPIGYAKPVPENIVKNRSYRKGPFYYMHLRTFRGWIFKLIKLQDLLTDTVEGFVGNFFPASNDLAMYYPIVEMAHTKIHFVNDILYTRNLYSDIVGFKVDRSVQLDSAREIKRKRPYPPLESPVYRTLNALKKKPIDYIVCTDNSGNYAKLKKEHSNAAVIKESDINKSMDCLMNDYVRIVCDGQDIMSSKDTEKMIYQLERTFACSVLVFAKKDFLNFSKNPPVACLVDEKLYACKNRFLQKVITDVQTIKSILLRTADFKKVMPHVGTIDNLISFLLCNNDNDAVTLLCINR
jgi:glycosyltransferase involved in cell wall biosynthesis